jgi:hypothetical protein
VRWPSGLALLVLLHCGPNLPGPVPEDRRRVVDVQWYAMSSQWRRTPWWRTADFQASDLLVYVLIAQDGAACRLSARQWAAATIGELWACADGWRGAR